MIESGRKIIGHTYKKKMCGFVYYYNYYNLLLDISTREAKYVFYGKCSVYKDDVPVNESEGLYDAEYVIQQIESKELNIL